MRSDHKVTKLCRVALWKRKEVKSFDCSVSLQSGNEFDVLAIDLTSAPEILETHEFFSYSYQFLRSNIFYVFSSQFAESCEPRLQFFSLHIIK